MSKKTTIPTPGHDGDVCPGCGRCRYCGRGPEPACFIPVPYPVPYMPYVPMVPSITPLPRPCYVGPITVTITSTTDGTFIVGDTSDPPATAYFLTGASFSSISGVPTSITFTN